MGWLWFVWTLLAACGAQAEPSGSSRPAEQKLAEVRAAEMPSGRLDPMYWSRVRVRDGRRYRTASNGTCYVTIPNFWGSAPRPPAGLYAIDITHFDTKVVAREIKIYSGGGEFGCRYIGQIRGTGTNRVVTDTLVVDAEDIATSRQWQRGVRVMLARGVDTDLISVAIRRASSRDVAAARQAVRRQHRRQFVARPTSDFVADIFEPGEYVVYRPTQLRDLPIYRDWLAGKNRELYRRCEIHYIEEQLETGRIVHRLATEQDLARYEKLRPIAATQPLEKRPRFGLVTLFIKKPPEPAEPLAAPPSGVVAFSRSLYGPISRVYTRPTAADVGRPIELRLARNEWEGAAVLIWTVKPQRRLRIRLSRLEGQAGELAGRVRLREVEFGPFGRQPILMAGPAYWWPPAGRELTISADGLAMAWVDIFADPSARPGRYRGRVEVVGADDAVLAALPLELTVLPIRLIDPGESRYRLGFFSGVLPAPRMLRLLRDAGCNTFAVWVRGTQPVLLGAGPDRFTLDFSNIDGPFREAGRLGFGPVIWVLAGHPRQFPTELDLERALLWSCPVDESSRGLARRPLRRLERYFRSSKARLGRPVRQAMLRWLELVAEHAAANDWPELALCPMDEPGYRPAPERDWPGRRFSDLAGLIHQAGGSRLQVFGLIRQPGGKAVLEDCDIAAVASAEMVLALRDRPAGSRPSYWLYGRCYRDTTADYARFAAGFLPMRSGAEGMLLWGLEWGRATVWQYVAAKLVTTAAFIGIREGADDRRYAETLLAVAKDKQAARAFLDELLEQVRGWPSKPLNIYAAGFFENALSRVKTLEAMRRAIADEIIRLSGGASAGAEQAGSDRLAGL